MKLNRELLESIRKFLKRIFNFYSFSLILIALGFISFLIITFDGVFFSQSTSLNPSLASHYGDLIGGFIGSIFSLAGVLLLFETLIRQKDAFQNQQLENKFFELIKFHRDNVSEMRFHNYNYDSTGKEVFKAIHTDFGKILSHAIEFNQIFRLTEKQVVNISYLILFYGSDQETEKLASGKFQGSENATKLFQSLLKNFQSEGSLKIKSPDFLGQQIRLGHYYRHLFQTVKFIDGKDFLTEKEKYEYIKTLRVQLSTYEQAMFFFNSLSSIGAPWELSDNNDKKLITKYKLIKNIPHGLTYDVNPKKYFPKIVFEDDEIENSL